VDGRFGRLLLQIDRFPDQRNEFVFAIGAGVHRQNIEHDHAVGRAANQCNDVVEAPDEATIARVSLELGSRGTGKYETLVAIPIDDFIASL